MGITFGNWHTDVHNKPDQQKRMMSATKSETTPAYINPENQTAEFPGKKYIYHTTLNSCDCFDFGSRQLPCKHIYRLAMELGLIESDFSSGVNKNEQFTWQEAVKILETLPFEVQEKVRFLLHDTIYRNKVEHKINNSSIAEALRTCSLFDSRQATLTETLESLKKVDLQSIIKASGQNTPTGKTATKAILINWILDNIHDIQERVSPIIYVSFSPKFQKAQRKTYSYLLQKFDNDIFYDDDTKIDCDRCFEGQNIKVIY